MEKQKNHTRQLAFTGLFTAVLAVLSVLQIPMPTGVPLTLQTFAVCLCGYVLGSRSGFMAAFLYVVIGAVGLPVFSGMKGGFGVLFGPTGGFLVGFLLLSALCGIGMEQGKKLRYWGFGVIGLIFCHICGAFGFSLVSGRSFLQSVLMVSAPYLLKDLISLAMAGLAGAAIRRRLAAASLTDGRNLR